MARKKPYEYALHKTNHDLFIIESLDIKEEINGISEGRIIKDTLNILGQRPYYCYVRNSKEFKQALELFRHSSYRYLHLSCHGEAGAIHTTLEIIPNPLLAEILSGKLKNRRLFVSACETGAKDLTQLIWESNKGINSIASPLDKVDFSIMCAFWIAFYTKIFKDPKMSMKATKIKSALTPLCKFYGIRINWSNWQPVGEKWSSMLIH